MSGIALAVFKYNKDGEYYGSKFQNNFFYKLLVNQYYLPHFWDVVVCKVYLVLAKFSWKEVDLKVIDTIVDGVAARVVDGGEVGSSMQSGNLSKSLKWMGFGILVLLILVLVFSNLR